MINTPGYPLGTYRVPLGNAHLGTLEANFFVSWAILKISKPTTLSGEFIVFFDQVDPLDTPGHSWAPLGSYRVPLGDAHLGTLEVNFFVYWAIFKISKPTTISGEYVIFFYQVDPLDTPSHPRVPIVYPQLDAYLDAQKANLFVSWAILNISKTTNCI